MRINDSVPIHEDGLTLLMDVAHRGTNETGLLFHGSPQVIDLLEPRPVYWKDPNGVLYDDSEGPVVCASDMPFIATFMALVPRSADWGYISKGNPTSLKYYIEASYKQQFMQAIGYVMVLSEVGFKKVVPPIPTGWKFELPVGERQPEMRCTQMVKPLYAVKVTYNDFRNLLDVQGDSFIEYR